MKREWAMKWAKDLETTKAKQTEGQLKDGENGFCCLGRACVVAGLRAKGRQYDGESGALPDFVMKLMGIKNSYGDFNTKDGEYISLSGLNDNGTKFKEIAKIIRKNYKEI